MRKKGAFVWTAKIFNRVEIGSIYSVTELLKAKNWDIVHEIGDIAIYPKDQFTFWALPSNLLNETSGEDIVQREQQGLLVNNTSGGLYDRV